MADKVWKARERQVARLFGTERRPVSGRQRDFGGDDAEHPRIHIQSKYGRQNAREFALWDIASAVAAGNNKTPIVVYTAPHRREVLVLCRIEDLEKVAKEVVRVPQD